MDGGLSQWSKYTTCSKTCGEGTQHRSRRCNNPSPKHGGKDCTDALKEDRECQIKPCPGELYLQLLLYLSLWWKLAIASLFVNLITVLCENIYPLHM